MQFSSLPTSPLLILALAAAAACSGSSPEFETEVDASAEGAGGSSGKGGSATGAAGSGEAGARSVGAGAGGFVDAASTGAAGARSDGAAGSAGNGNGGGGDARPRSDAGRSDVVMPDPGSGICTDFTPCGGSVEGAWTIESICADPPLQGLSVFCPSATETISIAGTLDFGHDAKLRTQTSTVSHTVLPAGCTQELGGCGTGLLLQRCASGANGTCSCDSASANDPSTQDYRVDGIRLFATQTDGTVATAYFCRTGNQLLIRGLGDGGRRVVYRLSL